MGLLDRWTKKQTEEKLAGKTTAASDTETKPARKTTTKAAAKKEKVSTAPVATKSDTKKTASALAYKILVRPLVTEKSAVAQSQNKYSFVVARNATKAQIAQAVKEVYGVKPIQINVINVDGKRVRFGRSAGRRSDYKKAVVTLTDGHSIAIHEGV